MTGKFFIARSRRIDQKIERLGRLIVNEESSKGMIIIDIHEIARREDWLELFLEKFRILRTNSKRNHRPHIAEDCL